MADLPKIVRQRLRQEPGEAHPDADLLTAFAEQALGEPERAQVLAHLAACAACREVVALARPEEEGEEAAAAPRGLRGWVLRWQTAAALAAVMVAAIALLTIPDSYFHSTRTSVEVAKAPAETPAAAREETSAAASAPAVPQAEAARKQAEAKTATLVPSKKEAVGTGGGAGAGPATGPAEAGRARRDEFKDKLGRGLPATTTREAQLPAPAAEPTRQTPPAATYDYKTVEAAPMAKPQPAGGEQKAAVGGFVQVPSATQPPSQSGAARATATGVAAADQAQAAGRAQARARASNETLEVSILAPIAALQWRVNAAGKLQHTPDAGRSWRTMNVSAEATWNAVSAVGEHVWVGGHQQRTAVLYYSGDGGAHWARLEFTGPAGTAPADVVALNFTDAYHGLMTVVAASDSRLRRIWSTADGGHTWTAHSAH